MSIRYRKEIIEVQSVPRLWHKMKKRQAKKLFKECQGWAYGSGSNIVTGLKVGDTITTNNGHSSTVRLIRIEKEIHRRGWVIIDVTVRDSCNKAYHLWNLGGVKADQFRLSPLVFSKVSI